MSTFIKIKSLLKQLLPTGRGFKMPLDGDGDKFIEVNAASNASTYDDIVSTLNAILPDNANFTADDATDWEKRLGMIVSPLVDLEIRKAAIIRKMNHPGTIPARQSSDYIESQLHLAGFTDAYVHANRDFLSVYEILSIGYPIQLGDNQLGDAQLGNVFSYHSGCFHTVQLGDVQLGSWQLGTNVWCDIIANHIDLDIDKLFYIGENYRTFVIGGAVFGDFGNVDPDRIDEFRQLVLKLKPANSVAILLLNYT